MNTDGLKKTFDKPAVISLVMLFVGLFISVAAEKHVVHGTVPGGEDQR
jgi:hypothetical protein